MEKGSIVIVSLASPREKIWGQLVLLRPEGITVRGIELDAFDDFLRQVVKQEETAVGVSTVFFPIHRVERISLDEPCGSLPSLAQRFQDRVGLPFQEYLETQAMREK